MSAFTNESSSHEGVPKGLYPLEPSRSDFLIGGKVLGKLEKITFNPDGEAPVDFFVLEQTRIGGHNYILVTDFEEGDGEALILKDMSQDGEEESVFVIVSDDEDVQAVAGVCDKLLEYGVFV